MRMFQIAVVWLYCRPEVSLVAAKIPSHRQLKLTRQGCCSCAANDVNWVTVVGCTAAIYELDQAL